MGMQKKKLRLKTHTHANQMLLPTGLLVLDGLGSVIDDGDVVRAAPELLEHPPYHSLVDGVVLRDEDPQLLPATLQDLLPLQPAIIITAAAAAARRE